MEQSSIAAIDGMADFGFHSLRSWCLSHNRRTVFHFHRYVSANRCAHGLVYLVHHGALTFRSFTLGLRQGQPS